MNAQYKLDIQLHTPQVAFDAADRHIDLHNDYDCRSVTYTPTDELLLLLFEPIKGGLPCIEVVFDHVQLTKQQYELVQHQYAITLSSLHRAYMPQNGTLQNHNGNKHFYEIHFQEGQQIALWATSAVLKILQN